MALRSSNPVFSRSTFAPASLGSDRLSVTDVIVHTLGLLGLLVAGGVVGWILAPAHPGVMVASGLTAFALTFALGFMRTTFPPLVILFAALEGLALGGLSMYYESRYPGIVIQAALGTVLDFTGMLFLYRSGKVRATPRMRKVVYGTLMGVALLSLADFLLRSFSSSHIPVLNDATPLGILVSLVILVMASLQFVLDFDYVERAVAMGAPRSEAWRASYGILIGVVWVYAELLRLLSKLRR